MDDERVKRINDMIFALDDYRLLRLEQILMMLVSASDKAFDLIFRMIVSLNKNIK